MEINNTKVTDHLGNEFPSLSVMCAHYNITVNCFLKRKAKGLGLRDCLIYTCKKRFYKYKTHIFEHKEWLLAYAGTTDWEQVKDEVIIIQ